MRGILMTFVRVQFYNVFILLYQRVPDQGELMEYVEPI